MTADRPWHGLTLPRTATGDSSLVSPLPHHISVHAVHATFRADPARIERFLPPGLDPVDEGYGWVMVGDLVKVPAADPELLWSDPQRTQYAECVVGFLASYQGRVGRYTALVWVDRDWSIGMGPIFGWGKRMATVHRTRLPAINPAVRAMAGTTRWAGTVHRNGQPVVALGVDTSNGAALAELPHFGDVSFLYRYIPSPGPGIPQVEQLLQLGFTNVSTQNIRSGEGNVTFHAGPQEELADLGEVDVVQGFTYDRGWTTSASAVLLEDRSGAV